MKNNTIFSLFIAVPLIIGCQNETNGLQKNITNYELEETKTDNLNRNDKTTINKCRPSCSGLEVLEKYSYTTKEEIKLKLVVFGDWIDSLSTSNRSSNSGASFKVKPLSVYNLNKGDVINVQPIPKGDKFACLINVKFQKEKDPVIWEIYGVWNDLDRWTIINRVCPPNGLDCSGNRIHSWIEDQKVNF